MKTAIRSNTWVAIISLAFPFLAQSTPLPRCLDGYAFHARKVMTVSIYSAEEGNGTIGANTEIFAIDPYKLSREKRTWNGNFISSGSINLYQKMVVNGNVSSNIEITVNGIFDTMAINGDITSFGSVTTKGSVSVKGNVRAGANGNFFGDPVVGHIVVTSNINGNIKVNGNSNMSGVNVIGDHIVGGNLFNLDLCMPGSKPAFVGGTAAAQCMAVRPLPIPSPFSPIVLLDSCDYRVDPIQVGTRDFYVSSNDTAVLSPGEYKSVGIQWAFMDPNYVAIPGDTSTYPQKGCIKLNSGSYSMKDLWVPDGTCLELNTAGGNIEINVRDTLMLKGPNPIRFLGAEDPSKIKIYFAGKALKFRSDSIAVTGLNRFIGTLYAPNADVKMESYYIRGAIYANNLTLAREIDNQYVPYVPGLMGGPTPIIETKIKFASKKSDMNIYKINGAVQSGDNRKRNTPGLYIPIRK